MLGRRAGFQAGECYDACFNVPDICLRFGSSLGKHKLVAGGFERFNIEVPTLGPVDFAGVAPLLTPTTHTPHIEDGRFPQPRETVRVRERMTGDSHIDVTNSVSLISHDYCCFNSTLYLLTKPRHKRAPSCAHLSPYPSRHPRASSHIHSSSHKHQKTSQRPVRYQNQAWKRESRVNCIPTQWHRQGENQPPSPTITSTPS